MLPSKTIFLSLMIAKGCFLLLVSLFCCQYLSNVNSTVTSEYTAYICSQYSSTTCLTVSVPPGFPLPFESKSQNCSQTCPPSLTRTDGKPNSEMISLMLILPERSAKSSFRSPKKQRTLSSYHFLNEYDLMKFLKVATVLDFLSLSYSSVPTR